MNLAHWLARRAASDPDRPALFRGRQQVATYGQFWAEARALAGWLQAHGISPGDRVAIVMPNVPAYLVTLYGIWAAGAVAVPINAKLHGREVAYILENADARHVFAGSDLAAGLRDAGVVPPITVAPGVAFRAALDHPPIDGIVPRMPPDLAWLFYTSGTTGRPKGVMITFRMLTAMSLCYGQDVDSVRSADTTLYAAPMSHGAGLYNLIHVQAGARHVCPASAGFDPAEIFDLAAHFGDVQMFAAPTMVRRMTEAGKATGDRGRGLRTVVYAGGPMYTADIIEAVDQFGPVFVQIYGQGECPMGITALPRADVADRHHPHWRGRLQSVGRAQSAVEVVVGDPQGRPVPAGTPGEIMVRGDTVMPGYWGNDTATAQTLVQGWLRTGDMGVMDADGYLTLQDRARDMIITGGSNVYPREVEEVLLMDPEVQEVSVVGRPHPEWGEEVVAFVVGKSDPARLDKLCLDHIARFKRPKEYVAIAALPKNNYGKVLKTELRELLARKRNG